MRWPRKLKPLRPTRLKPLPCRKTRRRRKQRRSLLPRPPSETKRATATAVPGTQQVWVLEGGEPRGVPVKTGVSNGRFTEITGGELKPGMAVITEYQEAKK